MILEKYSIYPLEQLTKADVLSLARTHLVLMPLYFDQNPFQILLNSHFQQSEIFLRYLLQQSPD